MTDCPLADQPEADAAPVAWRWKVAPSQINWVYSESPSPVPQFNVEPLYAQPQCAPEPVAWRVTWPNGAKSYYTNAPPRIPGVTYEPLGVLSGKPGAEPGRYCELIAKLQRVPDGFNAACRIMEEAADALLAITRPERSPPDEWEALRGAAPNATGDLSSEEFIRQQRDEWDKDDSDVSRPDSETPSKIDPYKLGKEWCPDCKHDDGAHEPSCRYARGAMR